MHFFLQVHFKMSAVVFPLFATGVIDTGGAPTLTCEYLRGFLKKFEMTLMLLSETWGKMIHDKKPEAKNLVTLSL